MFLIFVSLKTCANMDSGLYTVLSLFAPAFSSLYGKILQSAKILYIRYHNITVLYSIILTHYFRSDFTIFELRNDRHVLATFH